VIEAIWFSTGHASVSKDLAVSGHGSGTALSTGNAKATAHANELVVGMSGPRMPGTATYNEDTADGYRQAMFTGDSKQSNDLSYKVVSSTGVFDYKPTVGVSSSWVDLLTTYYGS
jgi:ABC-type sulfate transport system substrate-binding protein